MPVLGAEHHPHTDLFLVLNTINTQVNKTVFGSEHTHMHLLIVLMGIILCSSSGFWYRRRLIVLMGIILCSSGGFWYRRRYYQQRIVTTIERQGQNGFVARTTHTMEELPSSTDSYCGPRAVAISQSATTANVPNVPVYPVNDRPTGCYWEPATGSPGVVTENCSSSATNTTTNTTILSG
ncbi:hypothetical protein Bbelb_062450 [Branchiostoma belcheri]|nr:hypothetical protein Bbelb_062450 [Branchiostoma belcheri]